MCLNYFGIFRMSQYAKWRFICRVECSRNIAIFLLTPNSHSKTIIDIFGSRLPDEIHQNVIPVQNTTLNSEYELKFREETIKTMEDRDDEDMATVPWKMLLKILK